MALLALGYTACLPAIASASGIECYDAKVRAKPVAQVPTVFPRSEDMNVIIISWPWFVDLDVRRVVEGDVEKGRLEALAVLHTGYVRKTMTFYLRRNSAGTYNILRHDADELERCPSNALLATPYLRLGPDRTYADERREGEERYRRYYEDDE
ncbi:hypothetical protein [Citromicrobium sp. JL477]|uniref:hypothetical protein n=2 Tax=Citromicrobium TaxID=72173 RepID=UPI0018D193C6|nr:hypothetical protein [Citromicrobium sp. JL477]